MRSEHRLLDARPLEARLVSTLRDFPDGATTKELEAEIGDAQYTISSRISKMYQYGTPKESPVEKIGHQFGPGTKWRLRKARSKP